jgi:hypothetical protein
VPRRQARTAGTVNTTCDGGLHPGDGDLLIRLSVPGMEENGVVTGPLIDELFERIDSCLRAEELDRRDLERGP